MKTAIPQFLIALLILCLGLSPNTQAISPPPDGGYPGGNTAEGQDALLGLTSGLYNTAVGLFSLRSNTTGNFNTAIGAGTLLFNTGEQNTATGAATLLNNTTGTSNTAMGEAALFGNTTGASNTAVGAGVLLTNTTGNANTALGLDALSSNTTGNNNTAIGEDVLNSNTTGSGNTVAGFNSGFAVTTANNVICIGAGIPGANADNSCFIGSIFGATSSGGTAVFIDSNNKLGTSTSSKRFKEEIKPMNNASEALFSLKPVSFRYKQDIDPDRKGQLGLIAEDVEKVNPDLIVRDKEGKPYSVRYDQVNAMLLNEFLKEHRKVEQLEKQIEALTAGLQKVNARLEAGKPAPQVAENNQ
jgi:hypothetical protein